MNAIRNDRRYTYADICSWDDDERWELIDGVAYAQAAPYSEHERVIAVLIGQLYALLKGKPCKVFGSNLGVWLDTDSFGETFVQPDISVICDKAKIDERGCNGAPDLIIEVLSPSTERYDMIIKFNKYLQAGVREYWLVNTRTKIANVNTLTEHGYLNKNYGETDKIPVGVLPGCEIELSEVFADV